MNNGVKKIGNRFFAGRLPVFLLAAVLLISFGQSRMALASEPGLRGIAARARISSGSVPAAGSENAQKVLRELEELNGDSLRYTLNRYGYVSYLDGKLQKEPCRTEEDVTEVFRKICPLVGGEKMQFECEYFLTDNLDYDYYTYVNIRRGKEQPRSIVRVILDPDGKPIGFSSSVIPLPDSEEEEKTVSEIEAVEIVRKTLKEAYPEKEYRILSEQAGIQMLPYIDELEGEEKMLDQYVVYTDNPEADPQHTDLPFLKHYVSLDGEYLASVPSMSARSRDDEKQAEARERFFENRESSMYRGMISGPDGSAEYAEVPVMKGPEGDWWLGDPGRKILCADYWSFAYGEKIVPVSSADGRNWNPKHLAGYLNYIKAYDFFAAEGWTGPGGSGEPMLILMDYQTEDHRPVNNLCYIGALDGWYVYTGSTDAADYHQALDIIGHEYSHGFMASAAGYVVYSNESGAVNEALADIYGVLIRKMDEDKRGISPSQGERSWTVGEGSGKVIRDLGNPNLFCQPRFSGDQYSVPFALYPQSYNDFGGVHQNSSILSSLACRLSEGGMDLEEQRKLWTSITCMIVPGSGFREVIEMLRTVPQYRGLRNRKELIWAAVEETRITEPDPYAVIPEGMGQLKLTLPPWINWDRCRITVKDRSGHLCLSWPGRGGNEIRMTLAPGQYRAQVTEYDLFGTCVGAWTYSPDGWVNRPKEMAEFEIRTGERLELTHAGF